MYVICALKTCRLFDTACATFLRLLGNEIPCTFTTRIINDMSLWHHWVHGAGVVSLVRWIARITCKEQETVKPTMLNNVFPKGNHSPIGPSCNFKQHTRRKGGGRAAIPRQSHIPFNKLFAFPMKYRMANWPASLTPHPRCRISDQIVNVGVAGERDDSM